MEIADQPFEHERQHPGGIGDLACDVAWGLFGVAIIVDTLIPRHGARRPGVGDATDVSGYHQLGVVDGRS